GRRVVDWVIAAARDAGADRIVVVVAPGVRGSFEGVEVAVQEEQLGTGDAVAAAATALDGFVGRVLVLDAAAPLLTGEHLRALVDEHDRARAQVTLLSIEPGLPLPYGRVVRDGDGSVRAIVEEKDASSEQRAIRELNSSIYVFESSHLWPALRKLTPANA